jgi:ABC-2 type transport system permease protein
MIRTIIDKEWAEVFKNRLVLFTVTFLPLFFTALPLVMLFVTGGGAASSTESADMPASFAAACGPVSPADCMQIYMINQFLLMYLIMPLSIPIAIAAYSVVGEKATRSLEPLLATPITTAQLMVGKALAAVIPAIAATWASFGLFVLGMLVGGVSAVVRAYVLSATWLIAILVIGPLIAVMAVMFALIVSSRVSDPRAAEQISAVLILPIMGVLFAQIAGVLVLNPQLMLAGALIITALDVVVTFLAVKLFQREVILTRWK